MKYEMDMCSGSIAKKMLLFTLPLMLSSILQLLFNAADIVVVGRFAGDNALAAVGSTGSLINLLTNVFIGLSVGTNVLTARFYGAGKNQDLKNTVHTSIAIAAIGGVILTIIGVCFAEKILVLMAAPDGVLEQAALYVRVYFLGMTSIMVYNFGAAILRAVGDTKRPLYYLLSSGVVNVILNLIFVIIFNMGVAGVAAATALSQTMAAFLVIRCLIREKGNIHFEISKCRIDKKILLNIVKIGLPAGFQGMIFSLSNVVIQSAINSFGATVVAGNSAASNIEGFVYVSMNAFYQACISFTSQNYGARKTDRIPKILITAELYVIATGLILGNLAYFFGNTLLHIYSTNDEVVAAGLVRLSIICTTYCLCGIMDVFVGSLRGIGYSILPMVVSLIGACALRLLWIATVFQIDKFHTPKTVYLSYPISWTITFSVHFICFLILWNKKKKKL